MSDPTAEYLARFCSAPPAQRREALVKLGQSSDTRAIALLEQIAATERDPALYQLALNAIQRLQELHPPVLTASPPIRRIEPPTTSERAPGPALAQRVEPASTRFPPMNRVSDQNRQLARSRLDYALSLHAANQNAKALPVLAGAARADPSILEMKLVGNLAMALTDEPYERALEILRANSQDAKVGGQAARPTFKLPVAELFATFMEMIGLLAAIILLFVLTGLGLTRLLNNVTQVKGLDAFSPDMVATDMALIQESGAAPNDQAAQIAQLQQLAQAQAQVTRFTQYAKQIPNLTGLALSLGLRMFLSTLAGILAAYIVGALMGGAGGPLRFIRYLTRAYIVVYSLIVMGGGLLYWLSSAPNLPSALQDSLKTLAVILMGGAFLLGFILIDHAAARAHQFGFFKGVRSITAGNIVLIVLALLLGVGSTLSGVIGTG